MRNVRADVEVVLMSAPLGKVIDVAMDHDPAIDIMWDNNAAVEVLYQSRVVMASEKTEMRT